MVDTFDSPSPGANVISPALMLRNDVTALHDANTEQHLAVSATCGVEHGVSDAVDRARALREFCCRLLGWSTEHTSLVDDVTHTLLTAIARGVPIALSGESDLVPVAYALHRRLVGAEHPFVVCDPRRGEGDGSVRSPPNRRTAELALEMAVNGSVCLRSNRLPPDFDVFTTSLHGARRRTTIFVCLQGDDAVRDLICRPLAIAPLAHRGPELDRLLDEGFDEAAEALGSRPVRPSGRLRQLVLEQVTTFAELEKTALRLVALASARSPSQAAHRLHMAPVSLIRWLRRRRWSAAILKDLEAGR